MSFCKIYKAAFAAAAALSLGGCFMMPETQVNAQAVVLGKARTEHVASKDVRLVMHGTEIPQPFEEIGLVQVYAYGAEGEEPPVFEKLRDTASRLGANGVVEVRIKYDRTAYLISGVAGYFPQADSN